MTCNMISKIVAAKGTQKLLYSMLTSYTVIILNNSFERIKNGYWNYVSSHQYIFCNIGVLKVLAKAVKTACERICF